MSRTFPTSHGPFTADQLRSGDPYELSNGHPIRCLPTGGRGSAANAGGAGVIGSDPDVDSVGVDAGFSPEPGTLRAPDVAVGVSDGPGWSPGAPPLAVKYADRGQDEDQLEAKIKDLLTAGTQWIWVVRLDGPRRVEVHRSGQAMRLAHSGDELTAPGILRNPVAVDALYDKDAADRVTLRNLLQRQGYEDLEDVIKKGRQLGEINILRRQLTKAFGELPKEIEQRLADAQTGDLECWADRILTAESLDEIFQTSDD